MHRQARQGKARQDAKHTHTHTHTHTHREKRQITTPSCKEEKKFGKKIFKLQNFMVKRMKKQNEKKKNEKKA